MARKKARYWDSDCFLGWLAEEPDKQDKCRGVLQKAEAGELIIATSTLTLAEVIKLKSRTPLPRDKRPLLEEFFKQEWIVLRDLTPAIGKLARELVWDNGIDPKDAVHVATALRSHIPRMDTFDTRLHKKDGQIGEPALRIGRPDLPEQMKLNWAADDPSG